MTGETPALSVIIPAFNAERTLAQQLAALERQSAAFAWEILLCDNGSTDGTAALVRDWQKRLPQLIAVDASANRGPAAARNVGARVARAPFLAFCDADDVVADDWLDQLRSGLEKAEFVGGARRYTLLNGSSAGPMDWPQPLFWKPFLPDLPATATNTMAVTAAIFREVGGFDENLRTAEDIDLCWRIQIAGHALVACPDAIVQIRRRASILAVFRQAYSYGIGDKALRRKYAALIAVALAPQGSDFEKGSVPSETPARPPRGWGFVYRLASKFRRPLRLPDITFAVSRLGVRLGSRFGKTGPISPVSLPQSARDS